MANVIVTHSKISTKPTGTDPSIIYGPDWNGNHVVTGLENVPNVDTTNAANITSGTLPAGRMPALTGDATTVAGAVATTIAANAVTNAKAAQMAANTVKCNPTGSTANAQDSTNPVIKGLTLNPTVSTTNQGLIINQSPVGTSVAPNTATIYPNANTYSLNTTTFTNENIGLNTTNGQVNGVSIIDAYGGANVNGIRQALYVEGNLFTASGNASGKGNYVAGTFFQGANNDGGGLGTETGAFFGMNPVAFAFAAATHIQELAAMEVNIGAQAGSSMLGKAAISIVQLANDQVQGTDIDAALWINNQSGAVGWNNGILFSNNGAQTPFASGATIMQTSGAATITGGVDLSSYTFTGNAFASTGFAVLGNGTVNATGYRTRQGTTGAAGGNNFNIYWTGTQAQLWIDTVNAGTITLTSDYRIKKDVKDAEQALDEVRKWRPITYTGADYGIHTANEDVRHSFIAHELKAVSPDCVVGEKDAEQLQTLDVIPIIARLAKAVQELDAEVAQLRAQLMVR